MRFTKEIDQLQGMLHKAQTAELALLYGSFGINETNPNSDIAIGFMGSKDFQAVKLIEQLRKGFSNERQAIGEATQREKVAVYFKSQAKTEFTICFEDTKRSYPGSESSYVAEAIHYEKNPLRTRVRKYKAELVDAKQNSSFQRVLQSHRCQELVQCYKSKPIYKASSIR